MSITKWIWSKLRPIAIKVRSIAIIYTAIYITSEAIPIMSETVKHLVQDKLTGTAGTVGTSVTSVSAAFNLDSIVDQISLYGGALVMVTVLVVNYYTIQSFRAKKKRESMESAAKLKEMNEKAAYYKELAEKESADKDLALYDLAITRKVVEAMGKGDEAHEKAAIGIESQVIQMREVRREA